jgi:hypothetical protein
MGTSVNLQLIETVVFPGDTLHCKVDIEPHEDPAANATEASSRIISARIQVYGQYIIDPSKSKHFTEDPQSPVENVEGLPKPGSLSSAPVFFYTELDSNGSYNVALRRQCPHFLRQPLHNHVYVSRHETERDIVVCVLFGCVLAHA